MAPRKVSRMGSKIASRTLKYGFKRGLKDALKKGHNEGLKDALIKS